jgi:hypothetical protein
MNPEPGRRRNRVVVAAAVACAALALGLQLLVPPVIGLADNGDYGRVMYPAGFAHSTGRYEDLYFAFLRTKYRVVAPGPIRGGYLTSEIPLAAAARLATAPFRHGGLFDIRVLGGLHALLLLLALGGILSACRELETGAQCVAAALLVFFFTDVGYVSLFNSFYPQTASLLFLLLTVAAAAHAVRRGGLAGGLLLAYFAFAALFVASKPQEAIQGPLLALFGARLAGVGLRLPWRRLAAWLAAALCAFSVWYGRSTPMALREAAIYEVVFFDLLPHSAEPARDAAELHLDPSWLRYSGTNAFQKDSPLLDPAFRIEFLRRVGYRRILRFYASHPRRLVERLVRGSEKAWELRPSFGNLEKSPQSPRLRRTSRFAAWSTFRRWAARPPLLWLALLLSGNLAAALGTYRRASWKGRRFREGVVVAAAMAATAFTTCILLNAAPDLSRTFYVAEALCDLLIVADVAWLAQSLLAAQRRGAAVAAAA